VIHIPLLFLKQERELGKPLLASSELETKPGSIGKSEPRDNESTAKMAIDIAAIACEKAAKVKGEKKSPGTFSKASRAPCGHQKHVSLRKIKLPL